MPNVVKTPAETWVDCARTALIADGLEGVKVDRLAKSLGVTRGGFYHHFSQLFSHSRMRQVFAAPKSGGL